MKHKIMLKRFILWLPVYSFLIFMIIRNSGKTFQSTDVNGCFGHRDTTFRYFDIICEEDPLLSDNTRITDNDISGGLRFSENAGYCIFGGSFVLFAAGIFFLLIDMMFVKDGIPLKFMIKYIHDQDGQSVNERCVFYKNMNCGIFAV
ncbi:MAG: hypothetical protein K6F71_02805 [Ruminococcus sp.]|uniref:hypothetical protein n=1 Tax=Ruminococcus sp. TaxID=41978 RepID=UPI0025F3EB0D|nr:hypothetical protein [Ruminococcus sp.]MCR5539756.1 hypothetical protein [Ruminococcus sp.]